MSELIMLRHGDVRISWNSRNEQEIAAAREVFDKRIKEGWSAFKDIFGKKGEKIKEFDPRADNITLVPPISGG